MLAAGGGRVRHRHGLGCTVARLPPFNGRCAFAHGGDAKGGGGRGWWGCRNWLLAVPEEGGGSLAYGCSFPAAVCSTIFASWESPSHWRWRLAPMGSVQPCGAAPSTCLLVTRLLVARL